MRKGIEDYAEASEQLACGEGLDPIGVVIENAVQFDLAIDYLRVDCLFSQSALIMHAVKECNYFAALGSCSDAKVRKYACYACAINLQKSSDISKTI